MDASPEIASRQASVGTADLKLKYQAEAGCIKDQISSADVKLSQHIYSGGSFKIEEEICKDNICFQFKAIQNPGLYEAYFTKPGPVNEVAKAEDLYLRLLKEQKIMPSKRVLMSLKGPSIDLQYYNLDGRQMRPLCEAVLVSETVQRLNLCCNRLTLDGLFHLGQLIRKSTVLHSLNLQHCKIGPEGVELLTDGLEVCQSLSDLDLSYNEIGDEGMKIVCPKLGYNVTIKKLNVSHNNLTHVSGFALADTMEENMGLQHLNLSWNQMNGESGLKKFFVMAVEANENLTSLDLSWNGLGGEKIANVMKNFIANHKALKELNLSHNRFETASDVIKLAKGISASECLQKINLSYNGITADVGFSLLSNINPKAHLRTLNLNNLWVKENFEKLRRELEKQSGIKVIIEGVSGGTDIKGPDMKILLLKRANYLGYKPKKNKKDFGWFLLNLQKAGTLVPVKKTKFIKLVEEDKIKYDEGMVDELAKRFRDENKKVDLNLMLEKYLELFPNTALPVPKEKKKKQTPKKETTPTGSPKGSNSSKIPLTLRNNSAIRNLPARESGTKGSKEIKSSSVQENAESQEANGATRTDEKSQEVLSQLSNVVEMNGIAEVNGITEGNGVTEVNGIAEVNSVAEVNNVAKVNGVS